MKTMNLRFSWIFFLAFILAACGGTATEGTEEETSGEEEAGVTEEVADLNSLTQGEIDDGWVLLFDGETSEGWRSYCKETFPSGWEIVDGTIHCIGSGRGEAGDGGDIVATKQYSNFKFKLEWKISEGGNSGIFYLSREKCGDDGQPIWKSAPEMQVLDNLKHPDANLGKDGNRQAGSLYDLIPANPQNANPVGEWNQVKITVYKGTVIHEMNGVNVLEYHLWTDDWKNMIANSKFAGWEDFIDVAQTGFIGLQDHGDDVWYRNIKIKEL